LFGLPEIKIHDRVILEFHQFSTRPSNTSTQGQVETTTKLEYDRDIGNFRWSSDMRKDQKEH